MKGDSMNKQYEQGVSAPIVLIVVSLIVIAGVGIYMYQDSRTPENTVPAGAQPLATPNSNTGTTTQTQPMQPQQPATGGTTQQVQFTGEVLAGTSSPLLAFNQADYEAAINSGKLVVLYYYANWCPICRAEFPKAEAAFDQLQTDQVVGFRVNFNDTQTDDAEKALAREHGVAYQHTKVFVKNGQRILKSPETWETDRYLTEINAALR